MKNPSTPHSQHFYPAPGSANASEPCLLPQKGGAGGAADGEPRMVESSLPGGPPPPAFHAGYPPEHLEPVVYVGAAVSQEDEAGGGSGTAPWRFFNLPRRKDSEFPTPALPGDKLRDEAALSADATVSVTE